MLCGLMLAAQSCNKEYFDQGKVEEILERSFHNDTVDANHTWRLMTEHSIRVTNNVPNTARIVLLSADPHESEQAELLAEQSMNGVGSASMTYSVHLALQQLYAAAVTTDGKYHVTPFNKGDAQVTLNTDAASTQRAYAPVAQEVYYCYCLGYPQPSATWDFNDLVLRLSRTVVDDYTLQLNVTLAAVGTTQQEAAAIRLVGISYDEVESLTRVDDKHFGSNEQYGRYIITEEDDLLRSRHDEAVINLFDDAHVAINTYGFDQNGQVVRSYYNVGSLASAGYQYHTPPTVSYLVKFRTAGRAEQVAFDKIDPFIVYGYNGAMWEIHKYTYKLDEVLFEYYGGNPFNYDTGYTWALEVPYSWFRYPTEGNAIGSYKNGVLFGAYRERGHSFGEWAAHRDQATDWYLYPVSGAVY